MMSPIPYETCNPLTTKDSRASYKYKGELGGIASVAINLLRVLVNRLQPQSVQVDSGGFYGSGRSCIPYDSYCDQGELGGIASIAINLLRVLVNRLQPQSVQVNLMSLGDLAFHVRLTVTKASWVW